MPKNPIAERSDMMVDFAFAFTPDPLFYLIAKQGTA
jgi:hypothetical protein